MVFVKAPVPGRVKTRLAAELGEAAAVWIYRTIGRQIIDRVVGGQYRSVVYFDPPQAEAEIRAWLETPAGVEYLPQPRGGLGQRLEYAFQWGFGRGNRVCVIGTDIPDLGSGEVEEAFGHLDGPERTDAVFGPAADGGYFLLALKRPAPSLFDSIPWSTPGVLARSLERAGECGINVRTLNPLPDVDVAADVPPRLIRRAEQLGLVPPRPDSEDLGP